MDYTLAIARPLDLIVGPASEVPLPFVRYRENGFYRAILSRTIKMSYIKRFKVKNYAAVRREAELLNTAASYGLAPEVYDTDYKTYIEMEDLEEMSVSDMYGDEIKNIPPHILGGMFSIVWFLYYVAGIEYRDLWPRNFIAIGDRVFIIDFGDARKKNKKCDHYLEKILKAGRITHWNPNFR